jgi:branched-chain amino acid transport system permease protein
MEKLLQAIYSGILYGSIYGLMAIGLTLVWGSLRMLNLAHGSLYLVGGYLAWTGINILAWSALPGRESTSWLGLHCHLLPWA